MASLTSFATGNWAAGGTWVGGVAPNGVDDTVIIANGHTVTIAAGTTAAAGNAAAPTVPAIQTAIAGGGTGILIVDVGATLTLKANVVQGNATWQVNAGAVVNFLHATANLTWQIADGNSQANAKLVLNGGTGANRITMQSTGAAKMGGFGWFGVNWTRAGQVSFTGFSFIGLGTAALPLLNIQGSATYVGQFTDGQFTSCGKVVTSNNLAVGAVFSLTRCTWRTPVSTDFRVVELLLAAGAHTGIAMSGNCWEGTFYVGGAVGVSGVVWGPSVNIGSSYGAAGIPLDCSTTPHSATVAGLFLYNKIAAGGLPSLLMNGLISQLVSIRTGGANQHAMSVSDVADTVISGGVWEFASNDETGDELQVVTNPAAPKNLEVTGIIVPPCPNGTDAAGSFINVSHAGSGANHRINSHHNTVFVSAVSATPGGWTGGENTTAGTGMFSAIRSNLWYRAVSGAGWGVLDVTPSFAAGSITNADYNGRFNMTSDGYQPANATFTTPTPPGTHDVVGTDPGFVAAARRFLSWGQSITGGLVTVQQVFDEVFKRNDDAGFVAGFTPANYVTYMRAGFVPTSAALRGTAHDASDIGAVALAAVVVPPPVLTTLLEDLAGLLVVRGVGTLAVGNPPPAHSIFTGSAAIIPVGMGPFLTLSEVGGVAPRRVQNQAAAKTQRPTVQVLVRAGRIAGVQEAYPAARAMARLAYNALDGTFNTFLNNTWYLKITAKQEPTDMGLDSTGTRVQVVFNVELEKYPS